jgi:hypothetical protein
MRALRILLRATLCLLPQSSAFSPTATAQRRSSSMTQLDASIISNEVAVINIDSTSSPKIGVLLLNLGGPETGDDVEGKI